ncbi:hypothetical protein CWI36_1904p0010, partial [Hamiltosporidium magnivora]
VQSKLIARVERLCHTRLNAKKLFGAINQHTISLINCHIGVLRLESTDFSKLDDAVRAVLVKNKIHLHPGCKEHLYFLRTEIGRGLHSVDKKISTRRAAILKVENNNKTHFAPIKSLLKVKFRSGEERASLSVIIRAEMHEEPTLALKQANIFKSVLNILKEKTLFLLFQKKERTLNINEDSDLE